MLKDICNAIKGLLFLPQWYAQKNHVRNKSLWTFGSWSGLRYSDNSRALYEYVLEHHPEIQAVWVTRSLDIYDKLRNEGKPVVICDSKEGIDIQRNAGYFFMTSSIQDGDTRYMNGIYFVNLWHGMPLKKIGEDAMMRIRDKSVWKRIKTWIRKQVVPWEFIAEHCLTVCGEPFFRPFFKTAFTIEDKDVWPVVEPRLYKLNQPHEEALTKQLNKLYGNPLKVLYMPTFRDSSVGVFSPFKAEIGFDAERLNAVLEKNNIVLLYKGHFIDEENGQQHVQGRLRTISDNDYDDLYSFINDVDVLITDYSSIYFDFLYLRKPIILFPFDEQAYISKSREFYFSYELLEAKKTYTWQEIEQCLSYKTYHVPSRSELERFCVADINNCCEQLVNIIINQ